MNTYEVKETLHPGKKIQLWYADFVMHYDSPNIAIVVTAYMFCIKGYFLSKLTRLV